MVRLQKYLADAGVASRRASEKLIAEGRVSVNGDIIREMGVQVDEEYDVIAVDGEIVKNSVKKEYPLENKNSSGFLCVFFVNLLFTLLFTLA